MKKQQERPSDTISRIAHQAIRAADAGDATTATEYSGKADALYRRYNGGTGPSRLDNGLCRQDVEDALCAARQARQRAAGRVATATPYGWLR